METPKALRGTVDVWNKGFGKILAEDGKFYTARHFDFKAYKEGNKFIKMEIGYEVDFIVSDDGIYALDIDYDDRSQLFKFAYFPSYDETIEALATKAFPKENWADKLFNEQTKMDELAKKAEEEDWFKKETETRLAKNKYAGEESVKKIIDKKIRSYFLRSKYNVLFSYFERTFERLKLEDKIVNNETDGTAAFNTGLGDQFDRDIYAVFKKNTRNEEATQYIFDKFTDANYVGKNFNMMPALADYFIDFKTKQPVSIDYIKFDCTKDLIPDYAHLAERVDDSNRFPESWKDKAGSQDFCDDIDRLLLRTKTAVRRNFRTAVPFYFPTLKKIQMLLPITFDPGTERKKISALVVSREGAGYSVETIMPLEWAYKNARLVARPDRQDWLDF